MNDILHGLTHGLAAPDVAIAINRAVVGTFFAISGGYKSCYGPRRESFYQRMVRDHIPFPGVMRYWVAYWEFVAGVLLVLGLFTVFNALVLAFICLIATCTDGIFRIKPRFNPISKLDYFDDIIYLPEVLYGIMLLEVVLCGPGRYSLDYLIGGL